MDAAQLQALLLPQAYPHPVGELRLIETHISWVILTGTYAYKIKKPLNLGFLDFSALARRRHFCEQELRLNRRFAPALYLEVVAITDDGGLAIQGRGEVVEYAVKMRQFDNHFLFDAMLLRGDLDAPLLRRLAATLADLHRRLPAIHSFAGAGSPSSVLSAARQNFEQLAACPLAPPERQWLVDIESWTLARYQQLLPAMEARVRQGAVKACHGDLHLGNIALFDGDLCIFDCIEFCDEFRMMDRIAELALLSMDIEQRGRADLAQSLLNAYAEYSGDYASLQLLDWYRCYYAIVRAKVCLMRSPAATASSDIDGYPDVQRYIQLAYRYTRPRPLFMVLMCGVSGSGKSTVAGYIAEHYQAVRLRSDVERKRLFALAPEQRSREYALDIYTAQASRQTFARLQQLAEAVLVGGFACVVDATLLREREREPFVRLAQRLGLPLYIVHCQAPLAVLSQRLEQRARQRDEVSEADEQVMRAQLARVEAPSSNALQRVLVVDSRGELAPQLRDLLQPGL